MSLLAMFLASCERYKPRDVFAANVIAPIPKSVSEIIAYSYKENDRVAILFFKSSSNDLDKIKDTKQLFPVNDPNSEMLVAVKSAIKRFEVDNKRVFMRHPEYYVSKIDSSPYVAYLVMDRGTGEAFFIKMGF